MRVIILTVIAFVLGGSLATCSPSGPGAPDAHAQLPGGERIVGVEDLRANYLKVLLLRADGSFRVCEVEGVNAGSDTWHCERLPAIPPSQ